MGKVFVSGCFDVLHAGHLQFFEKARELGDHLTVCVASDEVLLLCKNRISSLPLDHKKALIKGLKCVDEVVSSSDADAVFDFKGHILTGQYDILAVTGDDSNQEKKRQFCSENGIGFVVLPKNNALTPVSTTSILAGIKKQNQVCLRVDFAGGWLDVPRFARPGGFIVNCAIQPLVSLNNWPYEFGGGLGGSAARSILEVRDGIRSELDLGVGWQDPAVINETGLCVWRSGSEPVLELKQNPDWLQGKMLIVWTGKSHSTPKLADHPRDFDKIFRAGIAAYKAVSEKNFDGLCEAINLSYSVQLNEYMNVLPGSYRDGECAKKYLGGGHGGYALYIFKDQYWRDKNAKMLKNAKIIEPYIAAL